MKQENKKTTKFSVKIMAGILVLALLLGSVAVVISALLAAF